MPGRAPGQNCSLFPKEFSVPFVTWRQSSKHHTALQELRDVWTPRLVSSRTPLALTLDDHSEAVMFDFV